MKHNNQIKNLVLKTTILTLVILLTLGSTIALANTKVDNEKDNLVSYFENEIDDYNDWELILALYGTNYNFSDDFFMNLKWDSDYIKIDSTPSFYGSRILSLMAMSKNPGNIWQRNLIEELISLQNEDGSFGTVNDTIYSMLALNAYGADYEETEALRTLLSKQNEDGGFGFMDGQSDLDTTSTMLYVLSYYVNYPSVDYALEQATDYIKSKQLPDGGFEAWGDENSNSIAKVISGLTAIGEDIFSEKWMMGSSNMLDALLSFKTSEGSYKWLKDDDEGNFFSSKQVLMAYSDLINGNTYKLVSNNLETVDFSIRIEGIEDTLLKTYSSYKTFRASPTVEEVLVQVLEENNISYDITSDSTYGSYINSISDQANGTFEEYDGWMYTINNQSGMGISSDKVENSDSILFYYGSFAPNTLIPTIEFLNDEIYPNDDIQIKVTSSYYDWSTDETVNLEIENAKISFLENDYFTNENGIATIESGVDSIGEYKFDLSKETENSYPSLVRTKDITFEVVEAPYKSINLNIRIEGINQTLLSTDFSYSYKANQTPVLEDALEYVLKNNNIEYDIQKSSFGSYISSIEDDTQGTFGGYDGWLYLINNKSGMGISSDVLSNNDQILLYYGDMAPNTLVPEVLIIPEDFKFGDDITILVESTYDEYDENWNSQKVTKPIENAIVEYNNKLYSTNEYGKAYIKTNDSTIDESLYIKVYDDKEDSLPYVVRTEKIYLPVNINESDLFNDDEKISNWAKHGVYKAKELGIVRGYQNNFYPDNKLTRAEVVTMVMNILDSDIELNEADKNIFTDVHFTDWYGENVLKAAKLGIINGVGASKFAPNREITKQEFAVILSNAFNIETSEELYNFNDKTQIASWAVNAVNAVYKNNILMDKKGSFNPTKIVTREYGANAVAIICQVLTIKEPAE